MKQLIILAGGMGTRLRARLGDLPKPMIPIGGKPLLEHQIEMAQRHGFTDILIFACYRADLIEQHFGDGSRWGVKIRMVVEREPLGTAGAVLAGYDLLADDFVVMYGDTMVNVDLERIWQTHLQSKADATLLLHPNDHPLDSDLVEADAEGWITAFHNRPHPADKWFQNLVNAGLYVVRKPALQPWTGSQKPMDFGKDLFPAMLRQGAKMLAYNSPEFIKDIGTPERYDKINAEYAAGVVQRSSLGTAQRAVFLDRDGTLIKEVDGLTSAAQLELLPGVAAAIRELNHHGWRAILVTNQPVVAKGFCTEADVVETHNKLETLLGREHAFLDRIYWCPHHPEKGFAGERLELKIDCDCRKPKPGMVLQAAKELNLDLNACWLIGDTTTDLETAQNAGVRSVLVRTGHGGRDGKSKAAAGVVADNLLDAVHLIMARTSL
ncbi:MAG: D,D-heptose 1,7-bisphosphate phosphatase [Pedosphaera sp.]|nr:D,D-heptose 1,7-bisphosphate phosphatase [Pedosphaera sp.]